MTDVTYLWTTDRWLYLAVMLDLFSHRVVSWTMSGHIDEELVLVTLQMALRTRTASLLQKRATPPGEMKR